MSAVLILTILGIILAALSYVYPKLLGAAVIFLGAANFARS